jgi:hypothetical protein
MSWASSSTEIPDLTRRTLDWDTTSLLRGMSREDASVIFCVMAFSPRRAPKDSLSATNPSRRPDSPFPLTRGSPADTVWPPSAA